MLGYFSGGEESQPKLANQSEMSFTHSSGPTLNIQGSEAGTVFSHSVLDIGVDGPLVVLANGTTVEWSQGNPIYIENSLISTFIFKEIFLISLRRFLGISSSEKSIDASIRARQVFISSDHEKYLSLNKFP